MGSGRRVNLLLLRPPALAEASVEMRKVEVQPRIAMRHQTAIPLRIRLKAKPLLPTNEGPAAAAGPAALVPLP